MRNSVTIAVRDYLLRLAQDRVLQGFAATLGIVLLARAVRYARQRRNRIRITYPGGAEVSPRHQHTGSEPVRAYPSRFRVRRPRALLDLPGTDRARVRIVAAGQTGGSSGLGTLGAPPNVRLACQLRPAEDLSIMPLLAANAQARDGFAQPSYLAGQERNIAVLFADLRSFTGMAEHKLPYDLVFILNSYFDAVGNAISRCGGIVDKFIGDGVMALFGVETSPENGCRQALAAAGQIVASVGALSRTLAGELDAPLRIGVGIHSGPAVVGRMGYGEAFM